MSPLVTFGSRCEPIRRGFRSPTLVVMGVSTAVSDSRPLTSTHRLILPRDANHHGTLYAGVLLGLALEAGYASAYRRVGPKANLVLRRVLDLRCYFPVSVGEVVEIQGVPVVEARAHLTIGIRGLVDGPSRDDDRDRRAWMDALMQFVQVDNSGRPESWPRPEIEDDDIESRAFPHPEPLWDELAARGARLLAIKPGSSSVDERT